MRVVAEAWVDVQRHACGLLCGKGLPRPGLTLRRYRTCQVRGLEDQVWQALAEA